MHAAHSAEQQSKPTTPHQHRYMNFFHFNRQSSSSCSLENEHADDDRELDSWRDVRAIAFDVDSTVTVDEAIDELAKFIGCGEQVVQITKLAMSEGLDFTQSLERRLKTMKPSTVDIAHFLKIVPLRLTQGIDMLIDRLTSRGIPVFLITGGFDLLVQRVAEALKIPECNVFSNRFLFNQNGSYKDFDRDCLTSRTGGKGEVIRAIQKRLETDSRGEPVKILMVGDGITDAEASPPAHAFIGFGANVIRPAVKTRAKYFVRSVRELEKLLEDKKLLPSNEHHHSPFASLKFHFQQRRSNDEENE